ncbi:hypothetical protein GCM10027614_04620 [Micromonospora vulcania]
MVGLTVAGVRAEQQEIERTRVPPPFVPGSGALAEDVLTLDAALVPVLQPEAEDGEAGAEHSEQQDEGEAGLLPARHRPPSGRRRKDRAVRDFGHHVDHLWTTRSGSGMRCRARDAAVYAGTLEAFNHSLGSTCAFILFDRFASAILASGLSRGLGKCTDIPPRDHIGGGLAATGIAIQSWLLVGVGLIVLGLALWFVAMLGRER